MLLYLLGAMVLCIAALVLLLPHSASSSGKKGGVPAYNITNINNPSTTIGQSGSGSQSGHTTTVTSSQGNQTYQQPPASTSYSTTTILYVYCVGSPTPSFNQSYYSVLGQSGAISWKPTTNYPIPFLDGSCASSGSYVYCLGDSQILFSLKSTQAYYAPISSKGIGNWQQTTSYPVQFNQGSCTAYNNYIYCVGTFNSTNSKMVFYAPISSSGIGTWSQTTGYPAPFNAGQCNAYNGYIYCIGDTYLNVSALAALYPKNTANTVSVGIATANQEISGLSTSFLGGISYDYYAPLTASGVGQWKKITPTPQPVDGGSCTISRSTIYCIGGSSAFSGAASIVADYGAINSTTNAIALISELSSDNASSAFYATIGANGAIGSWTSTSSYPTQLQGTQCASNGMNIYCVGGTSGTSQAVYYANLVQGAGIASWTQTTDYPIPFYSGYCSTNANA